MYIVKTVYSDINIIEDNIISDTNIVNLEKIYLSCHLLEEKALQEYAF